MVREVNSICEPWKQGKVRITEFDTSEKKVKRLHVNSRAIP